MIVAAYTAVVAAIEIHFLRDVRMTESGEAVEKVLKNTTIMHSILGFVLSLLVVFRTNTAYDRWWEGTKAVGRAGQQHAKSVGEDKCFSPGKLPSGKRVFQDNDRQLPVCTQRTSS